MMAGKPARFLLGLLAVPAVLAAFIALDWYPTVKKLGRLRRERSDLELRIREYGAMAEAFQFPDNEEDSLLAAADADLFRALPQVGNDSAWVAISLTDLQHRVREDRIPRANFIFNWILWGTELGTAGPEPHDPLANWFWNRQYASVDIARGRFLWHGVLPYLWTRTGQRLANRHVVVALAAPLPDLLDFINHVSWGETRLEITRLHVEPGVPLTMAWLVCSGSYRVSGSSRWLVKMDGGEAEGELTIDPDSPLLLQKADPLLAPRIDKKELPSAGSPW